MTKTPLITKDQAKLLEKADVTLYSQKLAILAEGHETLTFDNEQAIKDFMDAVMTGDYVVETGLFYINLKHPDNVATGRNGEQFVSLVTTIDPHTKAKTIQIDFVAFQEATLFTKEMLESLPANYKIYASKDFLVPEVEAVKQFGDYAEWLSGQQEAVPEVESDNMEDDEADSDTVAEELPEAPTSTHENAQRIVSKTLEDNRKRDQEAKEHKRKGFRASVKVK